MDREKVIKGLRHCTSHDDGRDKFGGVGKCGGCPYYGHDCTDRMKMDALALLKEWEAVVRCKDCKECYFASNRIQSEQTFACGKHGIDVTPDWFCADGERAE